VDASGLVTLRLKIEYISKTLDHGRFTGTPPADENIQALVESERLTIEEATGPRNRNKLSGLPWRIIQWQT